MKIQNNQNKKGNAQEEKFVTIVTDWGEKVKCYRQVIQLSYTLPKQELIDHWMECNEPFDRYIAEGLLPKIKIIFHYAVFHSVKDHSIIDIHYMFSEFSGNRVMDGGYGGLADHIAQIALEPVADYIEGICYFNND